MQLEEISSQARATQGSNAKNVIQLNESLLKGDVWPLLPDGKYLVNYMHHETKKVFRTSKVFVHFKIVEPGEYMGVHLFRAYRVSEIIGKEGKNGRFRLISRTDLFLTLCNLSNKKLRPDQISIRPLKNSIILASVRTVIKDYNQRALAECLRYSVVDELISIEAGHVCNI